MHVFFFFNMKIEIEILHLDFMKSEPYVFPAKNYFNKLIDLVISR